MRGVAFAAVKTLLFTILVPGTVLIVIPYLLDSGSSEPIRRQLGPVRYLGLAAILAGVYLYFRCAWRFTVDGLGTPAPIDPPKSLVVRGPYRVVRNPMYVGVLAVGFGLSLWLGSVTLIVYSAFMTVVFLGVILLYEEPVLREKFGREYEQYCRAVPRFIPRIRLHRGSGASSPHE